MVIYNNNVGIGTTSPGAKLDVSGGDIRLRSNATYIKITDSNGVENRVLGINSSNNVYIGPIDAYQGGGIFYGASVSVQYHGFYGGGSEKVRITSSGNVGIGTTSPSDKLVVQGDGDGILVRSNDFTLSRIIPRGQTSTNWDKALFSLYNAAAENVRIDTAGSSWFNGGNVGIGTTSPSSKLQVNGGVQLANDTAVASASKVGTFRYRTSGNNSYVDMCMQTGASTYAWVNVVTNSW